MITKKKAMAKINADKVLISEVLTVGEYVKVVIQRTGNKRVSNPGIYYHLTPESTMLDYVEHSGMRFIVQNEKAASFTPGKNYASPVKKIRTDSFK